MRILLSALILITSFSAFADFEEGRNAILVNFGFTPGGPTLGADFEHGYHRTFGVGGYLRMKSDDEDTGQAGVTAFGAFIRPHFNRQNWDFSVAPGFGFLMVEPATAGADDETLLGPVVIINLLYEFNRNMALGVEKISAYGWFGEDTFIGNRLDDMYLKFRFMF